MLHSTAFNQTQEVCDLGSAFVFLGGGGEQCFLDLWVTGMGHF